MFGFYSRQLTDFAITPPEAERERRVVRQEYDLNFAANPLARAYVRVNRALYPDAAMGTCNIGTPETIAAYSPDAARAFHRRWYAKGNVTFVLTGDLDPAMARSVAEAALAPLPDHATPERPWMTPSAEQVERIDLAEKDAEITRVVVSYSKAVRAPSADPIQMEATRGVLQAFLGSALAGSPRRVLVEADEPVTDEVSMFVSDVAPGVFRLSVAASPAAGVSPAALLERFDAYLAGMPAALTAATVARLKQRALDADASGAAKPEAVAQRFTTWVAQRYPPEEYAHWPERIAAVTEADVVALATALAGPGRVVTDVIAPLTSTEVR